MATRTRGFPIERRHHDGLRERLEKATFEQTRRLDRTKFYATIFDLSPELSLEADMKKRFIGFAAVYMLVPAMLLAQPAAKKQLGAVMK